MEEVNKENSGFSVHTED